MTGYFTKPRMPTRLVPPERFALLAKAQKDQLAAERDSKRKTLVSRGLTKQAIQRRGRLVRIFSGQERPLSLNELTVDQLLQQAKGPLWRQARRELHQRGFLSAEDAQEFSGGCSSVIGRQEIDSEFVLHEPVEASEDFSSLEACMAFAEGRAA